MTRDRQGKGTASPSAGAISGPNPKFSNAKGGDTDDVNARLDHLNRRMAKSSRAQEENIKKIVQQNRLYNAKLSESKRLYSEHTLQQNSQCGGYSLPDNIDRRNRNPEVRELMAKNMKDFVIVKNVNRTVENSQRKRKEKQEYMMLKNEERIKFIQQKQNQLSDQKTREMQQFSKKLDDDL